MQKAILAQVADREVLDWLAPRHSCDRQTRSCCCLLTTSRNPGTQRRASEALRYAKKFRQPHKDRCETSSPVHQLFRKERALADRPATSPCAAGHPADACYQNPAESPSLISLHRKVDSQAAQHPPES